MFFQCLPFFELVSSFFLHFFAPSCAFESQLGRRTSFSQPRARKNRPDEWSTSSNETYVDWTTEDTIVLDARHRLVIPNMNTTLKSLEPLTEADEDENKIGDHTDDDAGELGAV